MSAQAVIFDLSTFRMNMPMEKGPASDIDANQILNDAIDKGFHCALVSDLPHKQAELQLREQFGETAHHIFSVVLTNADFNARGHKSPYSVVLRLLGIQPDEAMVVASSANAARAAHLANIQVNRESPTRRL